MALRNRQWFGRGWRFMAGASLVAALAACGHGMGQGGSESMGGPGMGMMGGGHHRGPMSEADMQKRQDRMIERVTQELALDATQKAHLVNLADALKAQRQAMGQPGSMRTDMQSLIAGERFDTAKAQALVNDKTEAMRKGSPQVISAAATFYDSLKPEQQAKVRDFMARGPHRGWGRG